MLTFRFYCVPVVFPNLGILGSLTCSSQSLAFQASSEKLGNRVTLLSGIGFSPWSLCNSPILRPRFLIFHGSKCIFKWGQTLKIYAGKWGRACAHTDLSSIWVCTALWLEVNRVTNASWMSFIPREKSLPVFRSRKLWWLENIHFSRSSLTARMPILWRH